LALLVHDPEIVFSDGIALICGLSIQADRDRSVRWDTLALLVHEPEIVLSGGIALIG
jgi:hypothetical protein